MKKLITLIPFIALAGCASFTTTQTDTSYEKGQPQRTITTKASSRTFFDSKSELAKFKASQTDKSQTASVGAMSQESSGSNAVDLAERLVGAAIRAAK